MGVTRMHIPVDHWGYPTRHAFVTMSTAEEAAAVFDALHESKVKGCSISTHFKSRKPKRKGGDLKKRSKTTKKSKVKKVSVKEEDLKVLSKMAKLKISGKSKGNKLNTKAKGKKSKKKKKTVKV